MGWGLCPYGYTALFVFIHLFIRGFAFTIFLHPATIEYIFNYNLGNSDNSNIESKNRRNPQILHLKSAPTDHCPWRRKGMHPESNFNPPAINLTLTEKS